MIIRKPREISRPTMPLPIHPCPCKAKHDFNCRNKSAFRDMVCLECFIKCNGESHQPRYITIRRRRRR